MPNFSSRLSINPFFTHFLWQLFFYYLPLDSWRLSSIISKLSCTTRQHSTIIVFSLFTYLCGFKYSYLLLIICTQLYGFILDHRPNDPRDRRSIPGHVIPKTQKKKYLIPPFLTQHYKVRIKGKVEQPREWSSTFPYTSVW